MEKSFRENVLEYTQKIPMGETRTYKEVARACGNENAARAVGAILKTNYNPNIPCHRVVRSDGGLGGYNRGKNKKKALLKKEQSSENLGDPHTISLSSSEKSFTHLSSSRFFFPKKNTRGPQTKPGIPVSLSRKKEHEDGPVEYEPNSTGMTPWNTNSIPQG